MKTVLPLNIPQWLGYLRRIVENGMAGAGERIKLDAISVTVLMDEDSNIIGVELGEGYGAGFSISVTKTIYFVITRGFTL